MALTVTPRPVVRGNGKGNGKERKLRAYLCFEAELQYPDEIEDASDIG
jgi:hypothetical protein